MKLVSKHINLNVNLKKSIPGNNLTGTPAINGEWLTFKEGTCVINPIQEQRIIDINGEQKTFGDWVRALKSYGTDFVEVPDDVAVKVRSAEPDHYTIETDKGRMDNAQNHRNSESIFNKESMAEMVARAASEQIKAMMPGLIEIVKNNLQSTQKEEVTVNIPKPIKPMKDEEAQEVEEEEDITNDLEAISEDIEEDDVLEIDGKIFYNGKEYESVARAKNAKRLVGMAKKNNAIKKANKA